MTELKIWGDDKPADGTFINLYQFDTVHAIFGRVKHTGFFGADLHGDHLDGGEARPRSRDRWCEVPEPPDWAASVKRDAIKRATCAVVKGRESLVVLEAHLAALTADD